MLTAVILSAKKPTRLFCGHDVCWGAPSRGHSGEAFRVVGERQAAQEAAKAALSRIGWR